MQASFKEIDDIELSVPILTQDSQRFDSVPIWRNEEDTGMHLAVSGGSSDAGRLGWRAEYAPEVGLAGADRAAFGGSGRGDAHCTGDRQEQSDGRAMARALPRQGCRRA